MRPRLRRSRTIAISLLMALSLASPVPVAAFTVYSATIHHSYCSGNYSWRGELPYDNAWYTGDEQTTGTVNWCFFVYRISDNDPYGDYYLGATTVNWNTTYNANGHYPPDNYGKVRVSSSVAAISNVYFTDPDRSVTINESCNTSVNFGLSYPPFSVGVSERFCSGGKLNLEVRSTTAGQWGSPDVTDTPHWEAMYMLKVPQGRKPLISGTLTIPRYNKYRDPNTLYWKYTKAWASASDSWQIR
jgi:hypothetical protein